MERTALETIQQHSLIESGDGIVLGLSGGADSTALLLFLCAIRERYNLKIHGVHIHHGLRGDMADRDENFSRELCLSHGVSFHSERLNVSSIAQARGLSFEMAGREVRYEVFEKERLRLRYNKIAVAHHRDDQGETMLLRLIRGSGLDGLVGIRPSREGVIIRPLLMCSKSSIEAYCASKNIQPMEDHTNLDSAYSRNFLRNEIIPAIDQHFGGALNRQLSKTAAMLAEDGDFIQSAVEDLWDKGVESTPEGYRIRKDLLLSSHKALRGRLIRKLYAEVKGNLYDLEQNHVAQITELADTQGYKAFVFRGVRFYGEHEWLNVAAEALCDTLDSVRLPKLLIEALELSGESLELSDKTHRDLPKSSEVIEVDAATIVGNLTIRHRQPGDTIIPFGMKGHKKIKDLLIDAKIPLKERDLIWLICDDEKVIWVYKIRQHEDTRVTKNTRQILRLSLSDVVTDI